MHRVDRLEDENEELRGELERLRVAVTEMRAHPAAKPVAEQAERVLDQPAALSQRRPAVGAHPLEAPIGTGRERALDETGPVEGGATVAPEVLTSSGGRRLAPPRVRAEGDAPPDTVRLTIRALVTACAASLALGVAIGWVFGAIVR